MFQWWADFCDASKTVWSGRLSLQNRNKGNGRSRPFNFILITLYAEYDTESFLSLNQRFFPALFPRVRIFFCAQ